jgi:O-succinylbenzoate synthase
MRIERIELIHYGVPLRVPIAVSFGEATRREGLYAVVHSEGLTGWGECPIIDGYHYETVKTAWHVASDLLIPRLLGRKFTGPEELPALMAHLRGHPFAKSMLEMAAWDLCARRDGVSFADKLAAPYPEGPKDRVATGISIGIQQEGVLAGVVADYLDQGYRRIKLKIRPGCDLAPARLVRRAFPEVPLMLDANSAYTLADVDVFRAMDDLDLLMLEQPLAHDDIYEHSRLRPLIATPLCLDESLHSAHDVHVAAALVACDIVNIKTARVGGWTEARRIHDLSLDYGLRVWIGGMVETEIGTAAKIAMAALPGVTLHSDIAVSYERFDIAVADPFTLNAEDSTVTVPTGPGLGIEIDQDAIDNITMRRQSFTTTGGQE